MAASMRYCDLCHRIYDGCLTICPLDGHPLREPPAELPASHSVIQGRYLILEPIATGGMGAIFRAYDTLTHSEVALKILKPLFLNAEQAVRRFFIEARAARRLDHPNIISIRDFGVSREGFLFLAMELLPGASLADVLRRRGRIGVLEALVISLAVCDALIHAHDNGIVHRDLKPENIFLVARDRQGLFVKVLDFGVAAFSEAGHRYLSKNCEVLGTPAYMSPEQVRGDLVDRRSDLYSLGIMLYEMLSGHPPFLAEDPSQTMRLHLTEQIPPLPPLPISAPVRRSLDRLLSALLQKRAEDRPNDAREARAMIKAVLDNISVEKAFLPDTAFFQDVLSPLRTVVPFHDRPTIVLDPKTSKFHDQDTLVVDVQSLASAYHQTVIYPAAAEAQRLLWPTLPWTIVEQRPAAQGDGMRLLSLLHAEFEYAPLTMGADRLLALLVPELEAFIAEATAIGGNAVSAIKNNEAPFAQHEPLEIRIVFGLAPSDSPFPESAVRAAENLIERVTRFSQSTSLPVFVRIGVSTDTVPKSLLTPEALQSALHGSRVDVSVRLARMALPQQVILDENTHAHLSNHWKMREIGQIMVRGCNRAVRIFALGTASDRLAARKVVGG